MLVLVVGVYKTPKLENFGPIEVPPRRQLRSLLRRHSRSLEIKSRAQNCQVLGVYRPLQPDEHFNTPLLSKILNFDQKSCGTIHLKPALQMMLSIAVEMYIDFL